MIAITGPDYSLEQVSGDSAQVVVDWARSSRRTLFLKSMPEQADAADAKEPSWLEQP
jgi:hypothetical protein